MYITIIRVPGIPATKGSWNVSKLGKFYPADKKLKKWQADISFIARTNAPNTPLETQLKIVIHFYLENPNKQDIDKLARAVLDSLEGIIYKNDSQIIELTATKKDTSDHATGAIIYISEAL